MPPPGRRPALPARDLLALSFLLALALLPLVRPIVLGGGLYDVDLTLMSIPVYSWYAEQLKAGALPLWSPDVMGGAPLAFVIYGFFYPPDMLLYRLLDAPRAFHLSLALHLALAGAATYWYCRVLGFRRLPSLLAAVAYQMGNEVLTWPSNGFITRTLFVLPALLAATELTLRRDRRWWLAAPPILAAALLGGYAQVALMALTAVGVYALLAAGWAAGSGRSESVLRLSLLALGVALGLGLAAVRVAPTLAVVALSTREGGMGLARSAVDSIPPWSMAAGYLVPALADLLASGERRPDYVGAPALLLAILALASGRRLGRVGGFHAGLAAVAVVLSLGEYSPAYGALANLPFFSLFRGPNRFSPIAALGIGVLAALALDRGLLPGPRWRRVLLAVGAAAGLAAAVALGASGAFRFGRDPLSETLRQALVGGGWERLDLLRPTVGLAVLGAVAAPLLLVARAADRISRRRLEAAALALTVLPLSLLGWVHNDWLPPSLAQERPAFLQVLQGDSDLHRVFTWAPRVSTHNVGRFYQVQNGLPAPSPDFEQRYLRQFLTPNLGVPFGVASIEWYDALQTRRQALLSNYAGSECAEVGRFADGDWTDWRLRSVGLVDRLNLLAVLNVKYVAHAFPIEDPRLEPVAEVQVPVYSDRPVFARVHLYRLKTALPRAFLAPEALVMPREQDVLEALLAGAVDPLRQVILEQPAPAMGGPALTPGGSSVEIVEYGHQRVRLRARTDGSGYLILMDFLLPGWTATVEGSPREVLAANFAGRAVPLAGAGEHTVEFVYRPPLFAEGLAASLVSLGLLAGAAVVALRRGPPNRGG